MQKASDSLIKDNQAGVRFASFKAVTIVHGNCHGKMDSFVEKLKLKSSKVKNSWTAVPKDSMKIYNRPFTKSLLNIFDVQN